VITRGFLTGVLLSILTLLGFYLSAAGRNERMMRAGLTSLMAVPPALASEGAVEPSEARSALIVDPLNQRLLNVAMVTHARTAREEEQGRWFTALARLGWRDTASRQNLLLQHAKHENIAAILDDIDGLLRRNRLIEQVSPALITLEGDLVGRRWVIERLRQRPAWRFGYLQRGSLIDDPVQLAARARTIRSLQQSGDDVADGEISPVLPKLIAAGLGEEALAIWRVREPSIKRPIADPNFAKLATERGSSAVPFHWQLTAAADYSVDATLEPAPHLSISWSGIGVPIFAAQTLSASAGRYGVILSTAEPDKVLPKMVTVRAVCGTDVVDFVHQKEVSATKVAYFPDRPLPCPFARLELVGRQVGLPSGEMQTAISGVSLIRLN